jgi:transcription elongation GreA/GreB family factor
VLKLHAITRSILIMKNTSLRKSVLAAARTRMEATAAELKERIRDLHAVTIGDDNAESASQTESTHGSDVELMNSLTGQLEHLQQDLDRLEELEVLAPPEVISYGSVVQTDRRNFLIAASVEEFKVDGTPWLGVTPRAPLIQALMGLKAGEEVTFNNVTYRIEQVL